MLLSDIQVAVINRIDNAIGLLPTIHGGKADGKYDAGKNPYAMTSIVPLPNQEPVYCDGVMKSGFILVNIFAPNGYGENEPTIQAEKFIALFPEGLEFDGITIPDEGDIKGRIDDKEHMGWFYVPTLIYFEARQ